MCLIDGSVSNNFWLQSACRRAQGRSGGSLPVVGEKHPIAIPGFPQCAQNGLYMADQPNNLILGDRFPHAG
jgi:hypothetical protein